MLHDTNLHGRTIRSLRHSNTSNIPQRNPHEGRESVGRNRQRRLVSGTLLVVGRARIKSGDDRVWCHPNVAAALQLPIAACIPGGLLHRSSRGQSELRATAVDRRVSTLRPSFLTSLGSDSCSSSASSLDSTRCPLLWPDRRRIYRPSYAPFAFHLRAFSAHPSICSQTSIFSCLRHLEPTDAQRLRSPLSCGPLFGVLLRNVVHVQPVYPVPGPGSTFFPNGWISLWPR